MRAPVGTPAVHAVLAGAAVGGGQGRRGGQRRDRLPPSPPSPVMQGGIARKMLKIMHGTPEPATDGALPEGNGGLGCRAARQAPRAPGAVRTLLPCSQAPPRAL